MILRKILAVKKREVASLRRKWPLAELLKKASACPKTRPFLAAVSKKGNAPRVIAEIKRRSPSKGLIRRDFRPQWIARRYQNGGAAALSVLTDKEFFGGSAAIFKKVRQASMLPILRKDFLIDEAQIFESRLMGADAVLLIAAALSPAKLRRLSKLAESLGMAVLFEIHTAGEWKKISSLKPKLVGINNRNLQTFQVDLSCFEKLSRRLPSNTVRVAESGIFTPGDMDRMRRAGARAVLVGESLMKQRDPGRALQELFQ